MPGGANSKPSPPSMRLARQARAGNVVWRDANPVGRVLGWLFLVGACGLVAGSMSLAALEQGLPALQLPAAIETVVAVAVIVGELLLLAWLFRPLVTFLTIVPEPAAHTVSIGRSRWGRKSTEVFHPHDVTHLVLLEKHSGKDYLQLRLVLADGDTRYIDQGWQLGAMNELAADLHGALGRPLVRLPSRKGEPFNARLTRLEGAKGETRWLDLEERSRRVILWVLLVAMSALAVGAIFYWVWIANHLQAQPPVEFPMVLGLLWAVAMTVVVVVMGARCAVRLRGRRLVGAILSPQARSITLVVRVRGAIRHEALTAEQVAAVVRTANRDWRCRRVSLEYHDGRRQLLERCSEDNWGLNELSEELAATLGVPVRDEQGAGVSL